MSDFFTFKDLFYLVLGLVLGLLLGIGIYWLPLGQFVNEWKALWDLIRKRYPKGALLTVKRGTDLVRVGMSTYPNLLNRDTEMAVWNDRGVDWFHTPNGWKRVRVLHIFDPKDEGIPPVYQICHLDIK